MAFLLKSLGVKGSCFMEEQNISPAAKAGVKSKMGTGCEPSQVNCHFHPTRCVSLFLSGAKTRRLLHSTLVRTHTHFTPNKEHFIYLFFQKTHPLHVC